MAATSGRNGFPGLLLGGDGLRGRGEFVFAVVSQLFSARFLGCARFPDHLVELVAHKDPFRIKVTEKSPLSRLEYHAVRSMLLPAPGKFNGAASTRTCATVAGNCSALPDMEDDPIGPVRFTTLLVVALFFGAALAQSPGYPSRTIRLVAGTAPGGITDYLARMSAEGLTARLGAQVVVENKAGATGNLAIEHVAKSAPDGYTLLLVAGGNVVITPFLYGSLPFDPLNDIVPVFNVAGAPQLLVVPGLLPVKDLRDFIALAEANPGTMNYAAAGPGSTTHLAADHFARLAGLP